MQMSASLMASLTSITLNPSVLAFSTELEFFLSAIVISLTPLSLKFKA